MNRQAQTVEVQVGSQGRVVIPAALRRARGIEVGQTLMARLEGERRVF